MLTFQVDLGSYERGVTVDVFVKHREELIAEADKTLTHLVESGRLPKNSYIVQAYGPSRRLYGKNDIVWDYMNGWLDQE